MWSLLTNVTDRQTDGQTDGRTDVKRSHDRYIAKACSGKNCLVYIRCNGDIMVGDVKTANITIRKFQLHGYKSAKFFWQRAMESSRSEMEWSRQKLGCCCLDSNIRVSERTPRVSRSTEHQWIKTIIKRRHMLFGHVARLDATTPAHQILKQVIAVESGYQPDAVWRRARGRPRNSWIMQIGNGSPLSIRREWMKAQDHGHHGKSLQRTSAVYASWWWWMKSRNIKVCQCG